MTGQTPASRRAAAVVAAERLIQAVKSHGPGAEAWYRKLLDIRDVLSSSAPDAEALRDAAGMFDELYTGPRNFSDFYIWSDDESARIRENRQLEEAARTLQGCLRP